MMQQSSPERPHPGPAMPRLEVHVTRRADALRGRAAIVGGANVETLVVGRTPEAAAVLLPRVFNLCRATQDAAFRLAAGLALDAGAPDLLRAEMLRDHVLRLCLVLPQRLGLAAGILPPGWAQGDRACLAALLGPDQRLATDAEGFARWCDTGLGAAPALASLSRAFVPDMASCPATMPDSSAAGRRAQHPLMQALERSHGRGPLWRAAGRLVDAVAILSGDVPVAQAEGPGRASAPSARGTYNVAFTQDQGRITELTRRTPTDEMAAPGGPLETAIAALRPADAHLLPLLIEVFDPCMDWEFIEATDA